MGKIIRFKKRTSETVAASSASTARTIVAAYAADANGQYIFVNSHWSRLVSINQSAALQDGWLRSIHPDDQREVLRSWQAAVRGERYFGMTYRIHSAKWGTRWILNQAIPQHDDDGDLTGYGGMIVDTSQFAKDTALDSNEVRLRAALDMTGLAFFEHNLRSGEIWGTAAFKTLCGNANTLREILSLLHPEDALRIPKTVKQAMALPNPITSEYRFAAQGKDWKHVKCHSKILFDAQNKPAFVIGIVAPAEAFVENPSEPGLQLLHRLTL